MIIHRSSLIIKKEIMSTPKELVVNVAKHQGLDLLNVHKFHYNMLPII